MTPAPNDIGGNPTLLWTFGKHQRKVQLTCATLNDLWDQLLIREYGDDQWIFVQYCKQAVIFEQFRMKIKCWTVVEFDWGMTRLTDEWMQKQVQIIETRREVLEVLGELARIGRLGRENILRTRASTMSANLDTTGLRNEFLVILGVLEGNLVTPLLGDTSYATLIDVLEAVMPPGWKYCDCYWWEKGI